MSRTAYMCGVDYQQELDPDQSGPVPVYSSVEALKRERSCWPECGIVRVQVKVVEWVEPQQLLGDGK